MNLTVNRTDDGVTIYPMHKHKYYEIMLYLEGTGHLRTDNKDIPFSPGTVIIVPPETRHGSAAKDGFKNISVCGDFGHLMYFEKPHILSDNTAGEGRTLASLIYNNRYGSPDYLSSLCSAYISFLLQNTKSEENIYKEINTLISAITERAFDHDLNVSELLLDSGYAEDYIRACFKRVTGKTPIEFLTNIRIDRARSLINIYGNTLSLYEIAERCGYLDYVYFSKKFRSCTGLSPREYKNSL